MTKELPRFFITAEKIDKGKFIIDEEQSVHKIRTVLRLKTGAPIELVNGDDGTLFKAEIKELQKNNITGIITERIDTLNPVIDTDKPNIILAQALPKASKMDDIIRMNTELGVSEFIPFESEYSVIKLKDFNSKKLDRWGKIALEAARQSEQTKVPKINPPLSFAEILQTDADIKLLLHSRDSNCSVSINEVKELVKPGTKVLVLIGPEGGFSSRELELACKANFQIVHLDLPILRTQTAGVVVCTLLLD